MLHSPNIVKNLFKGSVCKLVQRYCGNIFESETFLCPPVFPEGLSGQDSNKSLDSLEHVLCGWLTTVFKEHVVDFIWDVDRSY